MSCARRAHERRIDHVLPHRRALDRARAPTTEWGAGADLHHASARQPALATPRHGTASCARWGVDHHQCRGPLEAEAKRRGVALTTVVAEAGDDARHATVG